MLCERLSDPRRLADRHYIAEPKLDGQRAQLHIERAEAVACYSRHGLEICPDTRAWRGFVRY